jgi:hypothetical protein
LDVVGSGLPAQLLATAAAFLVTMPFGAAVTWTTVRFLITLRAAIITGILARSVEALTASLKIAIGLMIASPLLRLIATPGRVGPQLSWWSSWRLRRSTSPSFSSACGCCASAGMRAARHKRATTLLGEVAQA